MLYSGVEIKRADLLQKLLDTTQTMIFWKDTERRFVGVNQAFLDYYGFAGQEELIGKTDEEMGWHSNPDPFENDEWQILRQGISTHMVHGKCVARGVERDILASKKPLYANGKIIGLVGSFIDITRQVRQKNEIARLNRKLDGIPGGIAIYNRRYGKLHCISVNQCLLQLLGTTSEAVLDKNIDELLDMHMTAEEQERFYKECPTLRGEHRRAAGTFQFYNIEKKSYVWLQMTCQLVREPNDEERVYCAYTNVDKLMRYEKEVLASRHLAEERYAHAMRIFGEDRPQNIVARGHYNFTRNEVLSYMAYANDVYSFPLPISYDAAFAGMMALSYTERDRCLLENKMNRQHLLQAFEQGDTHICVRYRRLLPANEPVWLSIVLDVFANPRSGDIEGLSYAYDITLQVLEEAIINRLGYLGYDELGLVYGSNGFWRCYQYEKGQKGLRFRGHTSGSWDKEVERYIREEVQPEQAERVKKELNIPAIREKLAQQAVYITTQTTRLPDGAVRQKEIKFSYLNEVKDTIFYCMSDITEQFVHEHKQIAALKAAKQEAEEANETRAAFFASISHDMRTPLNGVIGYTDLALEAADMEGVQSYLSKIRISGNLLLALINDVLDFGKYLSHKIKLKQEPVGIATICANVETVIRPLADYKTITFQMERVHPYAGLVYADALRLQQILVNLLSNAVKFTASGGQVECQITEKEQASRVWCCIVVKDNGIGMAEEFLPRIFDPYAQEERSTASKTVGTGLGMAIVKQIVDLMDGSIEVKSRIDVGTVFTVYLELEKYSGTDVQSVVATELDYMDILRGKHVLLCEDNELNAEIAQLLLEHWGMIVTWEKNGKLALEAVRQDETAYDIILMDKRMAVMDGLDATVAIRDLEEASGRHIPIIAMTGDVDEESIKSCLDAGMDDHVGKPINRSELARSMVRLLKQRHCGV